MTCCPSPYISVSGHYNHNNIHELEARHDRIQACLLPVSHSQKCNLRTRLYKVDSNMPSNNIQDGLFTNCQNLFWDHLVCNPSIHVQNSRKFSVPDYRTIILYSNQIFSILSQPRKISVIIRGFYCQNLGAVWYPSFGKLK